MSDAQFTLLMGAMAALGTSLVAALRWAVHRVTASNDQGTAALIANTASNAVLVTKLDHLAHAILRLDDFVKEEVSGVHSGPPQPSPKRDTRERARTPREGVGIRPPRPGTFHDED
jgi:hypothetical protein